MPFNRKRAYWDMFILLLVAFTSVILPIQLAFNDVSSTLPQELADLDLVSDFLFVIDILLNFRTAYIDARTARLIVSPHMIYKAYLARWFWIDLAGSMPSELIVRLVKWRTAVTWRHSSRC